MTYRPLALAAAFALAGSAAFADAHGGDPAAGEETFSSCKACHAIVADDGTEIYKGGKVGPNLYGVIGRTAGTQADFRKYGKDLVAAGEAGLVWDEANLAEFAADPRTFLRTYLDKSKAKSKMSFKLREGGADVAAYLSSVGPQS